VPPVVAFDTNVVVRLLVRDDPNQSKRAEAALLRHAPRSGVFISLVVLAEVVWVLRYHYGLSDADVRRRLSDFVRVAGVKIEAPDVVQAALDRYAGGKADFSDYLIVERAREVRALPLLTFDRILGGEPSVSML
jgi:predicted nucleic-acid-binding protein